jgi:CO dehydrogenase/acetyl-CoA synthase beta subunit
MLKRATPCPLGIFIQVAGREMQEDFEPILERQIHHLINYAQGIMHIGQRDIAWVRVARPPWKRVSPSRISAWSCTPNSTRTSARSWTRFRSP